MDQKDQQAIKTERTYNAQQREWIGVRSLKAIWYKDAAKRYNSGTGPTTDLVSTVIDPTFVDEIEDTSYYDKCGTVLVIQSWMEVSSMWAPTSARLSYDIGGALYEEGCVSSVDDS